MTVDDYLDEWFTLQRTRLEPSSWHNYATMARVYLRPGLGSTPLAELTTRQLDPRFDDEPRRLCTWDADQVARFLRTPRERELHDLWRVALVCSDSV